MTTVAGDNAGNGARQIAVLQVPICAFNPAA